MIKEGYLMFTEKLNGTNIEFKFLYKISFNLDLELSKDDSVRLVSCKPINAVATNIKSVMEKEIEFINVEIGTIIYIRLSINVQFLTTDSLPLNSHFYKLIATNKFKESKGFISESLYEFNSDDEAKLYFELEG